MLRPCNKALSKCSLPADMRKCLADRVLLFKDNIATSLKRVSHAE